MNYGLSQILRKLNLKNMKPTKRRHQCDAFPQARIKGVVDSFQAGTGARFSLFPAENATGNFVKRYSEYR